MAVACVMVATSGCGGGHAPFRARPDAAWVAFQVHSEETADILFPVFRNGAKELGCSYDNNCTAGIRKACYGVTAYCWEETISLVLVRRDDGLYSVGCLRPTTLERCNELLTKLMTAWSPRADYRR